MPRPRARSLTAAGRLVGPAPRLRGFATRAADAALAAFRRFFF
ncbi:MAG TPA: hypothetical protein VGQ17_05985 [Gemmatimonadales bacterium]|nr:hypothetical protein [Gemmatimonadales bacterium]